MKRTLRLRSCCIPHTACQRAGIQAERKPRRRWRTWQQSRPDPWRTCWGWTTVGSLFCWSWCTWTPV